MFEKQPTTPAKAAELDLSLFGHEINSFIFSEMERSFVNFATDNEIFFNLSHELIKILNTTIKLQVADKYLYDNRHKKNMDAATKRRLRLKEQLEAEIQSMLGFISTQFKNSDELNNLSFEEKLCVLDRSYNNINRLEINKLFRHVRFSEIVLFLFDDEKMGLDELDEVYAFTHDDTAKAIASLGNILTRTFIEVRLVGYELLIENIEVLLSYEDNAKFLTRANVQFVKDLARLIGLKVEETSSYLEVQPLVPSAKMNVSKYLAGNYKFDLISMDNNAPKSNKKEFIKNNKLNEKEISEVELFFLMLGSGVRFVVTVLTEALNENQAVQNQSKQNQPKEGKPCKQVLAQAVSGALKVA